MFPNPILVAAEVTNDYERYLPDPRTYNAAMHLGHMAAYREALRYAYGRQVLDLGCGAGYGAFFLASYGAAYVAAIDLNPLAVYYAQQTHVHPRLAYHQADAGYLPFADHCFDFVFSSQVIEHVSSVPTFLREVARVLKPEGMCLLTTPNQKLFTPEAAVVNPHHLSEMSWEVYQNLAQQVFPGARFRGIPQCCLTRNISGGLELKPNALIRPADYVVQDHNLAVCENMLCYGLFRPAAPLLETLPSALCAIANELRPFFWEAITRRWLVLGLYPADDILSAETLGAGESITQSFILPVGAFCGVEVDLAKPAIGRCHIVLKESTPTGRVLVEQELLLTGSTLSVPFAAAPLPAGTPLELTLCLLSNWGKWFRSPPGISLVLTCPLSTPPAQRAGVSLGRALALRTFHAALPPIVNSL